MIKLWFVVVGFSKLCHDDKEAGLTWTQTVVGKKSEQLCPPGSVGMLLCRFAFIAFVNLLM